MQIAKKTYEIVGFLPNEEKFGFRSQMTRAAISIPSNVAEGSSRGTGRAYKQFVEIALGSAFELETQLMLVDDLKLVDGAITTQLKEMITEEQKILSSFLMKLKAKS